MAGFGERVLTVLPHRVRIAAQVRPQHATFDRMREACRHFEELGVDLLLTHDHFYPAAGDPDGRHYEGWTTLAAWAESTHRAELGVLVTATSYRNPNLLADMARTVDHISGGRLVLGIGAGWMEREYLDYGYELGTPATRSAALAADLATVKCRWQQLNPPPLRSIPVMVGGGGERKTLRTTAQYADIWHGFGDAETIARKHAVLDDWCHRIGRDPMAIERAAGVAWGLRGSDHPGGVLAHAQSLYDVGTRLFTVGLDGPDYDDAPVRELLSWRDEINGQPAARGEFA